MPPLIDPNEHFTFLKQNLGGKNEKIAKNNKHENVLVNFQEDLIKNLPKIECNEKEKIDKKPKISKIKPEEKVTEPETPKQPKSENLQKTYNLKKFMANNSSQINFKVKAELGPRHEWEMTYPLDLVCLKKDQYFAMVSSSADSVYVYDIIQNKIVQHLSHRKNDRVIRNPSSICKILAGSGSPTPIEYVFIKTDKNIYRYIFDLAAATKSETKILKFDKFLAKLDGNAYGLKPVQSKNAIITIYYQPRTPPNLLIMNALSGQLIKSIPIQTRLPTSSFRFFSNIFSATSSSESAYFYLTCLKHDDIYRVDIQTGKVNFYGNFALTKGQGGHNKDPAKFMQIAGAAIDDFENVLIADSKNRRIVYVNKNQILSNLGLPVEISSKVKPKVKQTHTTSTSLVGSPYYPPSIHNTELKITGFPHTFSAAALHYHLDLQKLCILDVTILNDQKTAILKTKSPKASYKILRYWTGRVMKERTSMEPLQFAKPLKIKCLDKSVEDDNFCLKYVKCPACNDPEYDVTGENVNEHTDTCTDEAIIEDTNPNPESENDMPYNRNKISITATVNLLRKNDQNFRKYRPSGINFMDGYLLIADLSKPGFLICEGVEK